MTSDFRTTVETLGDLKTSGMGLYAHCTAPNAGHGSPLDLDELIRRLGESFVYINDTTIGRAAVCKRCGHKGAFLTVIANTKGGWISPYVAHG